MAKRYVSSAFFLVIYLAIFVPHLASATVPAIFVLGDSTADVGTNSMLPESLARADFPFYGIDFPNSRPTGRFSNGLIGADFLAKLVGFKRSPQPFLYLSSLKSGLRRRMFRGVNFASGASGLLDITGQTEAGTHLVYLSCKIVPLSEQIAQLATVISNRTAVMGQAATQAMLSESLFYISVGSNDIFGYFFTNSTVPPEQYIDFKNVEAACCGSGRLNGEQPCTPKADLCLNRNEYLFWDLYHPTQAASKLAAITLYGGGPRFVTPINFAQLAA
ncbi:hypothetical protein RJ640_026887 [Escallonia rubra]|uniref:GDSL esterase/lipase n=1 Tax=Escallonia rubra TaxID=112253 RepID=A0AA88S0F6_9ASTE|nr:hypothetical protein RJ640_026887 [Escallonia rubra]